MSTISSLSFELVEHIVYYIDRIADLYQCARVSKSFYMASTPKLWYSPTDQPNSPKDHSVNAMVLRTLYSHRGPEHYYQFDRILTREEYEQLRPWRYILPLGMVPLVPLGHCIRKLQLSGRDRCRTMVFLLDQTPLVEDLTITKDFVINIFIRNCVAERCPQLTRIHLHANPSILGLLASFAKHCRHIRHIVLSLPTRLALESLAAFKDHRLESLEIEANRRLTMSLQNPKSFLSGLQNLTSFKIGHFGGIWSPCGFMAALLPTTTTTRPLPLLTSFTITNMFYVDDDFMVPFIAAHPRLESMVLNDCKIGEATLYAIATHLSRLRHLSIDQYSGLSPQVIKHVVDHCPVLDKVLCSNVAAERELKEMIRLA
ncbi:hypothetical protein [Absidia glauca]|uniref:Uncharacterized protein n=1 Tax=Absidia glauca TaxID=4829 RepID=A0A168LYL4_ABSGL|nr:hypothetical protein [Absidia glauca]